MRTLFLAVGLLGVIVLLGSARADEPAERTNSPKSATISQPTSPESLPPGEHVGRLVRVNPDTNALVLRITTHRQVLKNPDGPTRTFDQIVQDVGQDERKVGALEQDAVYSRSLAEYERKRQEAAKAVSQFQKALPKQLNQLKEQQENPRPVEYVDLPEPKNMPLITAKAVKVRIRDLPAIDADGRVRHYTADEIKKAKGQDPYEAGFDGKLRDLNPGEYLRVTVVPKLLVETIVPAAETEGRKVQEKATEVIAITVISKEQAEKLDARRP